MSGWGVEGDACWGEFCSSARRALAHTWAHAPAIGTVGGDCDVHDAPGPRESKIIEQDAEGLSWRGQAEVTLARQHIDARFHQLEARVGRGYRHARVGAVLRGRRDHHGLQRDLPAGATERGGSATAAPDCFVTCRLPRHLLLRPPTDCFVTAEPGVSRVERTRTKREPGA